MSTIQHKGPSTLATLFTSEDKGNFHKILGFSCLSSFLYRYFHLGEADCNFGPHPETLYFVILHFLLHVSSFIFRLPSKRIVSGYRLWPEARLHALVFTCRSLAFFLLFYYEDVYRLEQPLHFMNLVIVLTTCAAGDFISRQQKFPSRTIRDLDFPFLAKWFFSTMQFLGTNICLVGVRRYNLHLSFIFIIQVNAFLMTLRRKNLASHTLLVSMYAVLLAFGGSLCLYDDKYSQKMHATIALSIFAAMLRLNLSVNKYVLWTGMWLLEQYLAESLQTNQTWILIHLTSWLIAFVLGLYKAATIQHGKTE